MPLELEVRTCQEPLGTMWAEGTRCLPRPELPGGGSPWAPEEEAEGAWRRGNLHPET